MLIMVFLIIPQSADAQPLGLIIENFGNQVSSTIQQPQHKWLETSTQYQKEGDTYSSQCHYYSDKLNARLVALYLTDKSSVYSSSYGQHYGEPVPNQEIYMEEDDEAKFLSHTRDYWCNLAKNSYDMAIETSSGNDIQRETYLYRSAAGVYLDMGNTEAFEQANKKAAALQDTSVLGALFSIPLPPVITLVGILGAILLIRQKKSWNK